MSICFPNTLFLIILPKQDKNWERIAFKSREGSANDGNSDQASQPLSFVNKVLLECGHALAAFMLQRQS